MPSGSGSRLTADVRSGAPIRIALGPKTWATSIPAARICASALVTTQSADLHRDQSESSPCPCAAMCNDPRARSLPATYSSAAGAAITCFASGGSASRHGRTFESSVHTQASDVVLTQRTQRCMHSVSTTRRHPQRPIHATVSGHRETLHPSPRRAASTLEEARLHRTLARHPVASPVFVQAHRPTALRAHRAHMRPLEPAAVRHR